MYPQQLYQTPEYKDDEVWASRYQQLKQMEKIGHAKGMVIPTERPDSPNYRLARAGITPQQPQTNMNFGGVNMDSIPTVQQFGRQYGLSMESEIPDYELNRMLGRNPAPQMQQQNYPQAANFSRQMCRVMEGAPVYNPLNTGGFMAGGPVILCKQAGVSSGQFAQTTFAVVGQKNCYVVQLNEKTINLQQIHNSPNMWTQMVEIKGAMGASVLVPQQALQRVNSGPQQQQPNSRVLLDSNQQPRGNFARMPQMPGQRTILRG